MYKDTNELIEEAMGLKGMIAEVQSKARLLKSRSKQEQKENLEPTEEFEEEVDKAISQMHKDLAKYSRRLEEIYEELQDHEIPDIP